MDGLTVRAEDLGLSDEALERVAKGERVTITRDGKLFARVVVADGFFHPLATLEQKQANSSAMLAGREELRRRGLTLSQIEIREMRNDLSSEDD